MFGRNSMRFQPSGPTVGGSLVPVKFNGFNGQPVQRSYAGGGLASLDAKSIPRETLERLPFATLERMRRDPGVDQNFIAPLEHAAFTREFTKDNPLIAAPAMALATPAYTALKAIGYYKARSDPSLEEILQGYRGIGEGLSETFDEQIKKHMAPFMPVPEAERQARKKMAEGGAVTPEVETAASDSAVRRFLDFPTTRMAQGGHVKKHKESGYYAVNNKYAEGGAIRRPSIPRELPGNIDEAVREMARLRRLGIAGAKGFTGLGEAPSVMRPEELEAYGTGETAGLAADVADLIPGVGTAKALAGAGLGALKGGLGLAGMIRQGGIPNINMFHNVEGGPRSLLEALEQTQRRGIGSFDNLSVGIGPNIYGYAEGPTLVMNPRSKEFDPATAARNQLFNRDAYTARLSRGANLANDYRLTEGYTPEEAGQTAAILASPSFRSFKEYEESPYGVAVLSPFDEEARRLSEGVTEDYNLWLDRQNMFGNLDPSSQMNELINAANKGDPEAIRLLELYRSMPSEYAELKIPGRTPISRENVSAILIPHFMDKNISPVDFIERLSDVTDVEFGTPYAFATKDMREQLHDLESNTAKEIADIVRSSTSHKDIMENLSPEARKYFSSSFSRQLYDDPSGIPELTKEMFRASPEFASDVASDITRREFLK